MSARGACKSVEPRQKESLLNIRIRQQPGFSRIRQIPIYQNGRNHTQEDVPTPRSTAIVGILRPDDSVAIRVPVHAMLLHHSQLLVLLCPSIFRSACRLVDRGGHVRACKTGISIEIIAVETVVVCSMSAQIALEVR